MADNGRSKELCIRAVMRSADAVDKEQVENILRRSLDSIAGDIDIDAVRINFTQVAESTYSPDTGCYESDTDWNTE